MQKLLKPPKFIDNLLTILLLAIFLSVPLYPKFPLFFIPGVTVAVRLEDVLIFSSIAIWIYFYGKNIRFYLKDKIFFAIFVFFIIGLFSVFSGAFVTKTLSLSTGILHWGRRVQYISLFFIARTVIDTEKKRSLFIKAVFIVIAYAFFYGIGQKYFELPVITTQNSEYAKGQALFYLPGGHLVSTFAGHYDLSTVLILFAPLTLLVLFATKDTFKKIFGQNKIWLKILVLLGGIASLWLLVQAANRISIASYMGVSVLALLFVKKYKYIPIVIIAIILFIGLSSNLIRRYISIFDVVWEQVVSLEENLLTVHAAEPSVLAAEDRSTSIRLNVEWPRAIRSLRKNPFFGTGYSSITLATDNDYLRALGETGLMGAMALGFVFLNIIYELFKQFKAKSSLQKLIAVSVLAALPGIFLNMVFIDILEASKFAILFWFMMGMALSKNYEKTSK